MQLDYGYIVSLLCKTREADQKCLHFDRMETGPKIHIHTLVREVDREKSLIFILYLS